MECEREEESGDMSSPNESGEYTPCRDAPNFAVQGLRDALTEAESAMTGPPHPADEFIIQLELTMTDQPGRLCPPAYSWNGGMVQPMLKGNPALRDLEHVQVDGPGLMYLFFMTGMDITVSPKRKPYPSAHTLGMLSLNGSGDLHALTQFLYCWKQDDNVQQPCRKGAGNMFCPSRNLFYLYTLMNSVVLDHHNWWMEWPQRLRRKLRNRKCLGSTRLDCIDDRPNQTCSGRRRRRR